MIIVGAFSVRVYKEFITLRRSKNNVRILYLEYTLRNASFNALDTCDSGIKS